MYIYVYIYMYVCMYVCMYVYRHFSTNNMLFPYSLSILQKF